MSYILVSNEAGAVPTGSDLSGNAIAINFADKKIYTAYGLVGQCVSEGTQTFLGTKVFHNNNTDFRSQTAGAFGQVAQRFSGSDGTLLGTVGFTDPASNVMVFKSSVGEIYIDANGDVEIKRNGSLIANITAEGIEQAVGQGGAGGFLTRRDWVEGNFAPISILTNIADAIDSGSTVELRQAIQALTT